MKFYAFGIEEAVAQAKSYFNCDEDKLVVKEIKAPSNKFIKFLSSKGIYDIDINKSSNEDNYNESTTLKEDLDGFIEVANGVIKVTNPKPGGMYPVVVIYDRAADLIVNGNVVESQSELREEDNIEVIFHNEPATSKIKAWLSEDKLKAYVKIVRNMGKDFFLKDSEPAKRLVLQLDYKETEPDPPSFEDCIEELKKIGVDMKFLNYENIYSLLEKSEGEVVAAEGEPPVHGIDSKIEYLFQNENYRNPDFDTDKKINLLDHTIIPHVKVGDVLAVKSRHATAGTDGVAVNGSVLKARNGIDFPLKAGSGVAVEDNKIISMINGRPNLKYGVVSVIPTLVFHENVSVETGNINFDGDIVIRGNVEENLCVRVTGNVQITGNVYHASVYAGGNIEIKGQVINSRISAGTNMIKYLLINSWLKQMMGIIKAMKDSVNELQSSQAYVNIKYHVRKLIIQYKEQTDYLIGEIESKKRMLDNDDILELDALLKSIKLTLTGINARCIDDFELVESLTEDIKNYIWCTEKNLLGDNKVVLNYSQNSVIQANGSIIVSDKGSFQSDLVARDSIVYTSPRSIVRGGYLIAGNIIKMKSVGSMSGTTTYCRVINKEGKIEADNFSNVLLDVGGNIKNIV